MSEPPTFATLRGSIAHLLPEALERAVASYRRFVALDPPMSEPKDFKDHHMAGRTALAHLEALLRLARWATPEEQAQQERTDQAELGELIAAAQQALTRMRGEADGDGEAR